MEVVQRTGGDSPFGRRDVEEWSRLDELTGMLEHARVQTDQWAGIDAQGGSHKYGKKVVDARKTGEKGQHLQRQQLEVFQSKVAGGALQMVKSQTSSAWSAHGSRTTGTSTTVSSRTRWSSRSQSTASAAPLEQPAITENFAGLELKINPIDVSTLKMKASVGRSGAIGSRRPPSARSRRLSASKSGGPDSKPVVEEPDSSADESPEPRSLKFEELKQSLKLGEILGRRLSKSSSTDDLPVGDPGRDSDDSGSWRRGARVRRSLQFSSKEDGSFCTPMVVATKRHSFVTVESLKDVRSRLKHFDPDDLDFGGPTSILHKKDDGVNSSSGLVRAVEHSNKIMASSTTTSFGSVSGKTEDDWLALKSELIEPLSLQVDKNRTVVTLNEQLQSKELVSPTKKRFNESFAFFRGGLSPDNLSPTRKTFPARQNMITIPIIFQQESSAKEAERKKFSLRSVVDSEGSPQDAESLGWVSKRQLDGLAPLKRRSWAGDSTLFGQYRDDDKTTSLVSAIETEEISHSSSSSHIKKNKRVEFCKTEVHFAAESGKFNIVETDEKPPPSNNFRRRRRSHPVANSPAENPPPQVAQKPPLPELRFGDTVYEKEMLTAINESKQSELEKSIVKVAVVESKAEPAPEQSKQITATAINRPSPSFENRPRPSSFHDVTSISKSTVALKFQPPTEIPKTSPNSTLDSSGGPMELQKLIKSLRPTQVQRRSEDFTQSLQITDEEPLQFSVPERIRYMEDRKYKGFSTTVNVSGTTVVRNTESIWLAGNKDLDSEVETTDVRKDVEETSSNRSPPQISPSKIVAPSVPTNPRSNATVTATNTGSSITSISLSYESQPKILSLINSNKKSSEQTKIVAPIPVKSTRPIKYPAVASESNKFEPKPACPRLEKSSALQASTKFSSLAKKEGSPVRLGDIMTGTTSRSLSPSKSKPSARIASPAGGKKKFYFGAEVLEVEPRPADDRRRLYDTDDESSADTGRKREPSPAKGTRARSASRDRSSTSALIEELTRAADEILQAVNGYDDSGLLSSEDESPRPVTLLPALKEGEVNNEKSTKAISVVNKTTTCSRLRKANVGRTSSNSSVESTTHDSNSTPRSIRMRKTAVNGTSRTAKTSETSTPTSRRQRMPRKRSDSVNSKSDQEEAEKSKDRLRISKTRRSTTTTTATDTTKISKSSNDDKAKSADLNKVRAPVERIIPPANRKNAAKSKKDDIFHSNRVINSATAERRLQLLENSCSGSGLRSESSPGMKRYQHRTVRNAPLKVSAK
ncbi:proteoglycan 4 isoform X2 [Cloeon dipterum]|uniref:proteoglycan 4 isoform X2 n=1 Tax=Cloeon dipterum TaxID=197152 RepID=UPI00322083AC